MPPARPPPGPRPRPPVSAVLITRDAAAQLADCLASVAFCAEVLVVDSDSADGTPELAERLGARVIRSHWRGFGPQKRFAVSQATHDWVLCVDADERVTPELRVAIEGALAAPAASAYRFARCNRFMGRYLRHGEGYPDWSLRLFDRRQAGWSDDEVHEKVVAPGPVATLPGDLLHDTAESLEAYLDKQNRYTTLAARMALDRGEQPSVVRMLASPLVRFVKFYLLRKAFLDGVPGLVHTLIGCANSFTKYAKMHAFRRTGP
ncbi:MAG: glycosyltransferase family 2 protein [Rhodocyclaceae bacterium]|nr:glycosyltransferase family 2 protein [Rhodocyclaceae bacterium]